MSKKDEKGTDNFEIQVQDAEQFRPKELPLLITPPEGQDWKNPEQAKYAQTLNAAAYANKNWNVLQKDPHTGLDIPNSAPKHIEIARLKEIGDNPDKYYVYSGEPKEGSSKIDFGNSEMLPKKPQ